MAKRELPTVTAAVESELVLLRRADPILAAAALKAAQDADSAGNATASSNALRVLTDVMDRLRARCAALEEAGTVDRVDDLAARREKRIAGGSKS